MKWRKTACEPWTEQIAPLPFSSAQPEPAPLGRRFAAWFVDLALIIVL